ncbi:hypothetical protein AFL20_20300, partial [Yersinia pestis subsp. microtus bv. Ulegeica]
VFRTQGQIIATQAATEKMQEVSEADREAAKATGKKPIRVRLQRLKISTVRFIKRPMIRHSMHRVTAPGVNSSRRYKRRQRPSRGWRAEI